MGALRLSFAATGELVGSTLSGVAHTFGTRTMRDGVAHEFAPTAFGDMEDVYAFLAHDTTRPLASTRTNSLRLAVRDGRLHYSMDLADQSYAHDLRTNVGLGLMDSMSFGVIPEQHEIRRDADGVPVRLHTRARLFDISPVTIPAFAETTAALHHASGRDWPRSQAVRARARVAERYKR